MKKIISLLVFALCLGACTKDLEEEKPTGDISGSVSDKTTGEPVATVNVTLSPGGKSTVTGSDGSFSFVDLDPGDYALNIRKERYNPNSGNFTVTAGKQTQAHLLIERIPDKITADKELLDFGDNHNTTVLSFTIVNTSYTDLRWAVSNDSAWIKEIRPANGVLKYGKTETIVVTIDRNLLEEGKNETVIVVFSSHGNTEVRVQAIGEKREAIVVNTLKISDIKETSATFNGEMVHTGIPPYTTRGFVYAKESIPTLENTLAKLTAPVNEKVKYTCSVTGLTKGETYYVRAFADNGRGTVYSSNVETFTLTASQTVVTTQSADVDLSTGKVSLHASIVAGTPVYTERGFCYGLLPEPTIGTEKRTVTGSGNGSYSCDIADLQFQTTYYFRAYAIQNGEVIYGEVKQFNTNRQETSFETSSATQVESTSAVLHATVYEAGKPPYSERGFCYSTSPDPTISDCVVKVSGKGITGPFKEEIEELNAGTTYYVRAYVIQNNKTVYGSCINFTTPYLPNVVTDAITSLTHNGNMFWPIFSATFNGEVLHAGKPSYIERGFVYDSRSNPTVSRGTKKVVAGSGTGTFSATVTDLQGSNFFYVRAYVKTSSGDYIYGETVSFNTFLW